MSDGKPAAKTYLVEVMPLAKGRGEMLSYFSSMRLSTGTLVRVPLKKGFVFAVVGNCRSTASAKSEIRRAGFSLRKIAKRDVYEAGFTPEFLSAVKNTSLYYASGVGTLFFSLLPKMLLEEPEKFFPKSIGKTYGRAIGLAYAGKEPLLLQMEDEERFGQYRAMVRQCFARRKSVMFVIPTHADAVKAALRLSRGIGPYVYVFTLKTKVSEAKKIWKQALDEEHPVLFITTAAGVAFDRWDLDTIIIERENSRAYRSLSRPYIHLKVFLENLCRATSRQLVLGDSVLSLETLLREKRGECTELSLVRWRLSAASSILVDARAKPDGKGKFEIFSPELKTLISKALEEKDPSSHKASNGQGKIFLFGARKGLAPTTICGDCGYILPCLNCGAPVVLHEPRTVLKNGAQGRSLARVYVCHACGTRRDSKTVCGYCGSWKLVPLGAGLERIAAEARENFHSVPVEILDKDYAPNDSSARKIVQKFNERGGILVGTELAFFHLEKVPYSALVSADSLFSIPDFGINERIFYLVSRLREMTQKESIIQTRNIGKQVLAWAAQGNIIDFYLSEIAERKELSYPPFFIFIKIQDLRSGIDDLAMVRNKFLKWHPDIYKDSIIMRIPRKEWPNTELSRELSLLPPQFSVKVDPESII